MPNSTTRRGLAEPVGSDTPSELRLAIAANAVTLDNTVDYLSGTFAARPAATVPLPGTLYRASDIGVWYQTTGTVWLTVPLAGAWTTLTLDANWSATATYFPPAYRVVGDMAMLSGSATATPVPTAGDAVIATLPAAARPVEHIAFSGAYAVTGGPGGGSIKDILIDTGGTMSATVVNVSGFDVVSLDGLSYRLF